MTVNKFAAVPPPTQPAHKPVMHKDEVIVPMAIDPLISDPVIQHRQHDDAQPNIPPAKPPMAKPVIVGMTLLIIKTMLQI